MKKPQCKPSIGYLVKGHRLRPAFGVTRILLRPDELQTTAPLRSFVSHGRNLLRTLMKNTAGSGGRP